MWWYNVGLQLSSVDKGNRFNLESRQCKGIEVILKIQDSRPRLIRLTLNFGLFWLDSRR